MASVWEIGIKLSLGRLELPMGISAFLSEATAKLGVQLLPVSVRHVEFLVRLPWHHKDPFDRLLLAQAKVEELALVSADGAFDRYGVRRIW
jgi:PIN domain nuclease of toxin-antitoxin system